MNLIQFFATKPTPYEENLFYLLQQIVDLKGEHPYLLSNITKGLYALIKREGWRHEYFKRDNSVLLFPSLTEVTEKIDCETQKLFNYYSELKAKKGES